VLINLLENAVKYAGRRKSVLRQRMAAAALEVWDNGPGSRRAGTGYL
jgi:K+-sensing histidine kinase KdpD